MKSIIKRGIVLCVAMALLVVSYPQNVFAKETSSPAVGRQNLNFITGKPGDTYLVYTYDENDTSYKVVESSDKTFENINSTTYKLNSKKVYEVYSTETIRPTNNDGITVVVKENGNVYTNTIEPNDSKNLVGPTSRSVSSLAASLAATPAQSSWSSWTESTGNTYIKNLTVTALIAVLGVLLTDGCAVAVAAGIAGAGAVAETLFNLNAKYFYYTEKYRYKTLKNNVLVITSEQSKVYAYSDKKHTNYLGLTTYSWSEY